MKITETISPDEAQKSALLELWNREYPLKLKHKTLLDLEIFLDTLKESRHYFLFSESAEIMGWGSVFTRDNDRWFAMILDGRIHAKGHGTSLLNTLKGPEPELNGWVIDHDRAVKENDDPYRSPLGFYLKNGFRVIPSLRIESDIISAVKIKWVK